MRRFLANATFFKGVIVWFRVRIRGRAGIINLVWVGVLVRARERFKVLRKVALRKVICEKSYHKKSYHLEIWPLYQVSWARREHIICGLSSNLD